MRTLSLTRSLTITLDGTGAGTAQLGPASPGERWLPSQVSVSCSEAVTQGTCQADIYIGPAATQPNRVDGTFSGDTGDTSSAVAGQVIWPGSYLFAVWSNGVPGALATVLVNGTREVP